jgi:nitrogen fixation protein FixH
MTIAEPQTKSPKLMTGRKVLIIMICFFAVIFTMNGVLAWLAFDSWSGLVVDKPYERGIKYNDVLSAAKTQHALGWRVDVSFDAQGDGKGRLAITAADKTGQKLDDLNWTGVLKRPTYEGEDVVVAVKTVSGGSYQAQISVPKPGQWDLYLKAITVDGKTYLLEQRLWFK